MTAAIEILTGDLIGRTYAIDEAPFTIGRKDDCAIVIPKKYVSRKHAEIVRAGAGFAIRGLSQKNPVLVNRKEVEERALADGDEFEICGIRFRFRAEGKGASKADRAVEKASGVMASLASAGRSRSGNGRGAQRSGADDLDDGDLPDDAGSGTGKKGSELHEIEDGPLPGEDDEETKFEFGGPASGSGTGKEAPRSGSGADRKGSASGSQGSGDGRESLQVDGTPGWKPEAKGRVVFGDEPAAVGAASAKKSKGSGTGSGDEQGDKEERTDQIDVSKLKREEDPFAPDEKKLGGRDPAAIAAREKFLKGLVGAGVLGIAIAAGILWYINRPEQVKPTFQIQLNPNAGCPVGESRMYSQPLSEDDPPLFDRNTHITGEPSPIEVQDPTVARVEWVVPDVQRVALFLVTGITEGTTQFRLMSRKGVTTIYTLEVHGTSNHQLLKTKRAEALAQLPEDELKRRIEKKLSEGEQLEKLLVNTGRPEFYSRQIYHSYELSEEYLNALASLVEKTGTADTTLQDRRDKVQEALKRGREDWEHARDHARTEYVDLVQKKDWGVAVTQLKNYLLILGDHCGADYQRFDMILEKSFGAAGYYTSGSFKDPGCIEEQQ